MHPRLSVMWHSLRLIGPVTLQDLFARFVATVPRGRRTVRRNSRRCCALLLHLCVETDTARRARSRTLHMWLQCADLLV